MGLEKRAQQTWEPYKKLIFAPFRKIRSTAIPGQDLLHFYKAALIHPRNVGAICPSSPRLASALAKHVHIHQNELVVELGAGTGVVTKELLQQGISPEQLIVIDASATMVKYLKQRFPNLKVMKGDAAHLSTLLKDERSPVSTIVSSIPLRALPRKKAEMIIHQIACVLPTGGQYIQFTYRHKKGEFESSQQFKHAHYEKVWKNLPPARVDVYVLDAHPETQ